MSPESPDSTFLHHLELVLPLAGGRLLGLSPRLLQRQLGRGGHVPLHRGRRDDGPRRLLVVQEICLYNINYC